MHNALIIELMIDLLSRALLSVEELYNNCGVM